MGGWIGFPVGRQLTDPGGCGRRWVGAPQTASRRLRVRGEAVAATRPVQNRRVRLGGMSLLVRFALPGFRYSSHASRLSFYQRLMERIETVPGFQAADLHTGGASVGSEQAEACRLTEGVTGNDLGGIHQHGSVDFQVGNRTPFELPVYSMGSNRRRNAVEHECLQAPPFIRVVVQSTEQYVDDDTYKTGCHQNPLVRVRGP